MAKHAKDPQELADSLDRQWEYSYERSVQNRGDTPAYEVDGIAAPEES